MNSKQLNNLLDFVFPAYVAFQFLVWTPIVYWIISPYFMDGLVVASPQWNKYSFWMAYAWMFPLICAFFHVLYINYRLKNEQVKDLAEVERRIRAENAK